MVVNVTFNNISAISKRSVLLVDGYVRFMMFNATFNNFSVISWRPVLVVEEAGVPGENHRKQVDMQ
jgi:hypothetical protein